MLCSFSSSAGEQFIVAVNRTAAQGRAAAAPPLTPRCEKLLDAVGDFRATLPGTRHIKSQPCALSGSHRDDGPRQDKADSKMGIQDRKYVE